MHRPTFSLSFGAVRCLLRNAPAGDETGQVRSMESVFRDKCQFRVIPSVFPEVAGANHKSKVL
jgi:hypothetical protein